MEVAKSLLDEYKGAGAYPVFFVWESGLLDVIEQQLDKIAGEKIFQRLVDKLTQFPARVSAADWPE
jgi:hypothetical protein